MLAACIKHFETEAEGCADYANEETGEARAAWNRDEERYQNCADDLRKLQPTAKYLEELLEEARREAELEGLKLDHIQHGISCKRCRRIAELEKARAEGKG